MTGGLPEDGWSRWVGGPIRGRTSQELETNIKPVTQPQGRVLGGGVQPKGSL
jgi:hypothetical protein